MEVESALTTKARVRFLLGFQNSTADFVKLAMQGQSFLSRASPLGYFSH